MQLLDQENVNGHDGYDWRMPEGTRAAAGGLVMFAGSQAPSDCPPLGRSVQAIYVQLRHQAPDGTEFIGGTASIWLWRDGDAHRLR